VADPRFFVDVELASGHVLDLPGNVAHHASHVLRLRDGAGIVLFNGRGGEYRGRLAARGTQAELTSHDPVERESPLAVTLVQAWIATDKLDWVTEKAVELGVARVVLTPARRSVVRLQGARLAKRLERLRDVVIAACCQCGRNRVPTIEAFDDLPAALDSALGALDSGVLLAPEAAQSIADSVRQRPSALTVAVGPEGGFEPAELSVATRAGYRPVRIGPRVLRTETAGLAAIAALQAIGGDYL
jgi:16S rRNA (uracil1498-N3)-methyltransferase